MSRDVRSSLPACICLRLLYVRKGRRRAGGDRVATDAGRDGPRPFEQRSRGLFILGRAREVRQEDVLKAGFTRGRPCGGRPLHFPNAVRYAAR